MTELKSDLWGLAAEGSNQLPSGARRALLKAGMVTLGLASCFKAVYSISDPEAKRLQGSEVKSMAVEHTPPLTFTHMLRPTPAQCAYLNQEAGRSAGRSLKEPGPDKQDSYSQDSCVAWNKSLHLSGTPILHLQDEGVGLSSPEPLPEQRSVQPNFLLFFFFYIIY